jgi:hypothetical protein
LDCAEQTGVRQIPAYQPISHKEIIISIEKINNAIKSLSKTDNASYRTQEDIVSFNLDLHISPESMEDLITREELESKCKMIMKVKKPDYLGESKWEFIFDNHIIHVKIIDAEWLKKFQNREIDVRPGDSIRAEVLVKTKYGYDFSVIGIYYEALTILEVLREENDTKQLEF